jgi:hypothetical protein
MGAGSTRESHKNERYLAYVAAIAALLAAATSVGGALYTVHATGVQAVEEKRQEERTAAYSDYLNAVSDIINAFSSGQECAPTQEVEKQSQQSLVNAVAAFYHSVARIDLVGSNEVRERVDAISAHTIEKRTLVPQYLGPVNTSPAAWRCSRLIVTTDTSDEIGKLVRDSSRAIDIGRAQLKYNE